MRGNLNGVEPNRVETVLDCLREGRRQLQMLTHARKICEIILVAYATIFPYHIGKGRVINAIVRLMPSLGRGQRLARRLGINWELRLECLIQRGVYYNCYEPWETAYLPHLVKEGMTVIDVGANIGYYSLLLGKLVGPRGIVHAFEPQVQVFEQLCRNIDLNNMGWIEPHRCALGDKVEQRQMTSLIIGNMGVQRIATDKDKGSDSIQVSTLDEFVWQEKLDRIHLIKVDIEGFEYSFLRGSKRILTELKPTLLMELNADALIAFDVSLAQVLSLLKESGYTIYQFERKKLRKLTTLPAVGQYCNIIAMAACGH